MNLPIIDTHIHTWDFTKAEYDWLKGDVSILNRAYHVSEINEARKMAGVTEGVLVQAANNKEDTSWMLDVAANTDWITGVVGWLPLMDPQATEAGLLLYKNNPWFKGVRHLIHNEPEVTWLLQDEVLESLSLLAQNNLSYDVVGVSADHLKSAILVAEKIPGLRMVFNHLNQPPIASKQQFGEWGALMQEAAAHKNCYAKISGLGTTANNSAWQEEDIKPYILFALENFGTSRCFVGGDWPVSLLAGSYTHTWNAYRNILESLLQDNQLQDVYSNNAKEFYRL
ncbi:MAG: amidohydrolase family protein [Bacteroidota bacterium]